MELKDVIVGERYTVDLKTAKGTYEVTKIVEPKGKDPYVEAIKYDPKLDERSQRLANKRSFDPAKLTPLASATKTKGAGMVVSEEIGVIESFGSVDLMDENVSYWPNHQRRGRPRKVA